MRTGLVCTVFALSFLLPASTARSPLQATSPVMLKVWPARAFAPATLRIRVQLEPDPENNAVELVIDSESYYRSSLIPLNGDRAPRAFVQDFRGCPSGDYEISTVLTDRFGRERGSARQHVLVLAPEAE